MTRRDTRAASSARPGFGFRAAVIAVALIGGAVVSYPQASPWIASVIQSGEISEYETGVNELDPEVRAELLAAAHEYNENLPNGPLRDPYVLNESGEAVSLEAGREEYEAMLAPEGADPYAPVARVSIPSIGVDLPIFLGTSEETLSRGVGHLYGSGLPVGGEGVHSVLTAHSGYVESTLFDDLPKVEIGDTFTIDVLGEVLTYRVDQIETTLPDESQLLRQVPGKDYVTLVTCTPRYVNTHRLLVRAERIPTPDSGDAANGGEIETAGPGFPWWLFTALGPALVAAFALRRRRDERAAPDPADP